MTDKYDDFAREHRSLSENQCRDQFARTHRMNEHDLDAEIWRARRDRNEYYERMDQ